MTTHPIPYVIRRTRRRSIALKIDPSGTVTVLAPRWVLGYFVEAFVRQRTEWIRKTLAHFEALRTLHPPKKFVEGEIFAVWGKEYPLEIVRRATGQTVTFELLNGRLQMAIPQDHPYATDVGAQHAVPLLRTWHALQTDQRLRDSVPSWAERMAVAPGRIKVVNQRRRWASCSRDGNLRFNWRLSMMPPAILEYVIVHELAHLKAHDHSKRFWSVVQLALPDFKIHRTWLRKNGIHFDYLN